MERRIETIYSTTTHEVVHLYQYDILGGPGLWWTEASPNGAASRRAVRPPAASPGHPSGYSQPVDERRSNLTQADGCYALAYDVGRRSSTTW